jgi:hypothetical protein
MPTVAYSQAFAILGTTILTFGTTILTFGTTILTFGTTILTFGTTILTLGATISTSTTTFAILAMPGAGYANSPTNCFNLVKMLQSSFQLLWGLVVAAG